MENQKDLNRRDFLISGAAGLTALGGAAVFARPKMVMGANDRVRVALSVQDRTRGRILELLMKG